MRKCDLWNNKLNVLWEEMNKQSVTLVPEKFTETLIFTKMGRIDGRYGNWALFISAVFDVDREWSLWSVRSRRCLSLLIEMTLATLRSPRCQVRDWHINNKFVWVQECRDEPIVERDDRECDELANTGVLPKRRQIHAENVVINELSSAGGHQADGNQIRTLKTLGEESATQQNASTANDKLREFIKSPDTYLFKLAFNDAHLYLKIKGLSTIIHSPPGPTESTPPDFIGILRGNVLQAVVVDHPGKRFQNFCRPAYPDFDQKAIMAEREMYTIHRLFTCLISLRPSDSWCWRTPHFNDLRDGGFCSASTFWS